MRLIGLVTGVMTAAAMVAPAMAQTASAPAVLKAATPWAIDYARDSCRAFRKYGTGADQVELVFITLPRSSGATLVVVTSPEKGPGPKRATFGWVRIGLQPGGESFNERYASAPVGESPRRLLYVLLDQAQLDQMIASNRIEIEGGKLDVVLEPGRTAAAFKALEPCHDDLLKSWEVDPEILRSAVNRAVPTGTPQTWVTNADYPKEALQKREQGTATFRLTIGADGKVVGCTILHGSGSVVLDDTVCGLMRKRAKFTPARDAAGKPVPDMWISRFRWELP
ncbi:energy transducer TonB [Sphingomonas sp. G-3-2-10]|uniref:energy transducer TonB n=1 Tax=Sphingomonas sp. G-3-2-10 TaxID=2728838 RepID=UPI00146B2177|nr:energy transducer TonB [Sphingomonas sp. G-3-2-10]NML06167.1 energy transducer TonB [Sphingomonas sp. G-3-2-10]